jgi:hypothetical protein
LHGPNLCLGILHGLDLCSISRAVQLCSGIFHDLCSGILRGPDLSLLLHGSDLLCGSLRDLVLGILHGLYGPDLDLCLCLCIILGRPSLELIQQGFG